LQLSYGNRHVTANVSIAAHNITDGGYPELTSQLGINQSFLSLKFPEFFGGLGGIVANVGVFSNRYGAPGRYSADKYDTYLFGATHGAGENVRAFFDLNDDWTLHIEEGFQAKLAAPPFVDNAISSDLSEYSFLPYSGPVQQGTTMVAHGHVGASYRDRLFIGGHLLTTWTDDAIGPNQRDSQVVQAGADVKLIDSHVGEGYLGYAHTDSQYPLRLAGALEMLHAGQGWSLVENYFGEGATGTGAIDTLLFQYTFSVAKAMWHPETYWGQARDLKLSLFGMFHHVASNDSAFTGATKKLKYGADILYTPLAWLGVYGRYDLVQPDLDDNSESFHALTSNLVLRSDFVSNEHIELGYTHYLYGDSVTPVWPHDGLSPDTGILKLSATMWW
jgi:hypothetical protein